MGLFHRKTEKTAYDQLPREDKDKVDALFETVKANEPEMRGRWTPLAIGAFKASIAENGMELAREGMADTTAVRAERDSFRQGLEQEGKETSKEMRQKEYDATVAGYTGKNSPILVALDAAYLAAGKTDERTFFVS